MCNIYKDLIVVKRSGQRVSFNGTKIAVAISKGFESVYDDYDVADVNKVYELVLKEIEKNYSSRKTINVEDIQNIIEDSLKKLKFNDVYISFSDYRLRRAQSREVFSEKSQHKFAKAIEKVGYAVRESTSKKPNELMDVFAKTISKEFAQSYLIEGKVEKALEEGVIYLNDLRNYSIGNTSSSHLNTNHLSMKSIDEYFNDVIKTVILCKSDQYKEHTLINFDTNIKTRLIVDYRNIFYEDFINNLKINGLDYYFNKNKLFELLRKNNDIENASFLDSELKNNILKNIFNITYKNVLKKIDNVLSNNFNKLFDILEPSIQSEYKKLILCFDNYDNYINNLIIKNYFKNIKCSKKIITNIFINNNEEINKLIYDNLDKYSIHLIFDTDRTINYFSNGERVYENINDNINTSVGKIINSQSTINLARIALKNSNIKLFFKELDNIIELNKNALVQRFDIQSSKYKENYNILMNNGLIFESEKLEDGQKVRKILRNGALLFSYSGIIEAVYILNNKSDKHLNEADFNLILKIVKYLKEKCGYLTKTLKLNFILSENLDIPVQKKFMQIDKSVFGVNKVLNKDNYETVCDLINNSKIKSNDKLNMLGKYQNITSTIVKIKLDNISFDKYLKLLEDIKAKNIKYLEFI